jgi:hypothetical protein
MKNEKELACKAKERMDNVSHESYVVKIYNAYIKLYFLDESIFIKYLRHLYSFITESQTPEQTLKNTTAAMALLKGGK